MTPDQTDRAPEPVSSISPGPWVIQDNAAHGTHIYSAGGIASGKHLARVSNSAGVNVEANARVIAAAPAMLAALDRVNRLWRMCAFNDGDAYDAAHREVSAAIAAARGAAQ